MSTAPRLSIGLAVYNGEQFLAQSLESLLGQRYEDFELMISDNASTDDTPTICRLYERQDSRIRYFRQPRNIGAAPNHNFLFQQSRGELFKWAAHDDLYARDLLERCVEALDEHPQVILANSWTAVIDSSGNVIEAVEYPLNTGAAAAPDRFDSILYGGKGGDDYGSVFRANILRQTRLQQSYHFAERTLFAELALLGIFYHVPDWLHFRRDHPRCPTVRSRCVNLDPRRADRLRHPSVRLYAEFGLGYVTAIRRAPLSLTERQRCYRRLARWFLHGAAPAAHRVLLGGTLPVETLATTSPPTISVEAAVAGRERSFS